MLLDHSLPVDDTSLPVYSAINIVVCKVSVFTGLMVVVVFFLSGPEMITFFTLFNFGHVSNFKI